MSNSLWLHGLHAAYQASLSSTISQSLLQFLSIESVMLSNHLILWCPLLPLPSIFASIGIFSKQCSLHIRWPSIGASALASVLPKNIQHWFPLGWTGLILQSKGLSRVQHHNSKASILWCSAFFVVQFSHLYMTIRKTIALTIQTFVGKVLSLLCNSCLGLS